MRTTRYVAVTLVLAGCLLVLASTGAFDSTHAERGMAVDVADPPNAFLGENYSGTKDVELESSDCSPFIVCAHYGVELVRFENNTNANLNISETPQIQMSGGVGEATIFGDGLRYEAGPPDIGRVVGDFTCPASGGLVPDEQESATSTVTIDVVASGDNLSVDLTRTISVHCEAGPVS